MSLISEAQTLLRGEGKKSFWLPCLALGYVSSYSASPLDFTLAVLAVGGARFWVDLVESDLVDMDDYGDPMHEDIAAVLSSNLSGLSGAFTMILALVYPVAYLLAPIRLWTYFNYSDPIIIGLSGLYASILVILLMNTGSYISKTPD